MSEQETPKGWRRYIDQETGSDASLAKVHQVNDLKHAYQCLLSLQELIENASENMKLNLSIDSYYLIIRINLLEQEELSSKHIKLAEDINSKLEDASLEK